MLWVWLLQLAVGQPAPEPSTQTLIYFNARMALREGKPLEAIKLWYLRNSLEDETDRISAHDGDLHSVTWAALGELGLCQDGLRRDKKGAGLWPLALHNQVVKNLGRRRRVPAAQPWTAFEVDRQGRLVSIQDVLDAEELATLRFFRGPCFAPRYAIYESGDDLYGDLRERQVQAKLLRHLLAESRETLARDRVRGLAAVDARLFDLDLQLTALAAREARRFEMVQARRARSLGLDRQSVIQVAEAQPETTLHPQSQAARILADAPGWSTAEWLSMTQDRRLFVFDHAREAAADPAALDAVALALIDALIDAGRGEELDPWIARAGDPTDPAAQAVIWSGDRGERLMALGADSGFEEGAVIALSRGVHHLQAGRQTEALRSMAWALQHAGESKAAGSVESLSLRWLTWIAGRYEITDSLLITLRQLVGTREYSVILEDLMWRSALRADLRSYERGLANQRGRGALGRRLHLLAPLAAGDAGEFERGIAEGLETAPSETLRFLDQLVQRLELEPALVRSAHLGTLARLDALLLPWATGEGKGRQGRTAASLLARSQAIEEGLTGLPDEATDRERARALDPSSEVFVGSVRLAPADPLPWPFKRLDPAPPSVFEPLTLTPEEWRLPDGTLVFGWSISG